MIDNSIAYYYKYHTNAFEDHLDEQIKRNLYRFRLTDTAIQKNFLVSSAILDRYPDWLKNYFSQSLNLNIDSIKVYRVGVVFDQSGKASQVSRELFLTN